jgi:hypothetical protein
MKILILLVIVACAHFAAAQDKNVCCTEEQWRSRIRVQLLATEDSHDYIQMGEEYIEYDAKHQQLRVDLHLRENFGMPLINATEILDYQQKRIYAFFGPGRGTEPTRECVYSAMEPPFDTFREACVPEGAAHTGKIHVGPPGAGFEADEFVFRANISSDAIGDRAVVSRGCWPLSGIFFDHHRSVNAYARIEAYYFDIERGINERAFRVPDDCKEVTPDRMRGHRSQWLYEERI